MLCKVKSVLAEIKLRMSALLKDFAVHSKSLVPLHFEEQLVGKHPPPPALAGVAEDLLERPKSLRAMMNMTLTAFDPSADTSLKDLLESREQRWMATDPYCHLDVCFLAGMNGEQGENILLNQLYACFPDESPPQATLKQCSQSVQTLIASPLSSFVSDSCRGATKTVGGIIASIAAGERPSFKKGHVAVPVQMCLTRMLNFCNYTNAEKETVHADTALNAAYQNLSYLLEKKTHKAITCENTQNFQLYWWACPLEWAPRIRESEEILQGRASQAAGSAEPAMKKSKSFKNAEESGSASKSGSAASSSGPTKAELLRSKVLAQF